MKGRSYMQISPITERHEGLLLPPEPLWYAAQTRSNFERRIAAELAAKQIESYLPAYEEIHQWKDRKKTIAVPLFPGYVFVRFVDRPEIRLRVLQTAGVVRVLGQAGEIEPIPQTQIEAVRAVVESRVKYRVHPLLREGKPVRVIRGPLTGLKGLLVHIKNEARLVVSVPLLGQSVAAEVNTRDVEPAAFTRQVRA